MSPAPAGRTPASFEIKSAQLPLVALLLKTTDLSRLAADLTARHGDDPDFFDHDPLVIDLAQLPGDEDMGAIDFAALIALLRPWKLLPVAVRGASDDVAQRALAAGLAIAPEAVTPRAAPRAKAEAAPAPSAAPVVAPAPAPTPVAAPAVSAAPAAPATALIVDRPLRSGQQVYARGRDLVVMAMVNPGAEVIADGSIHVYAPLRGRAIAGARGDSSARIFSLCLEPELISIAGVYRTSDSPLPATVHGKPTQVRLDGDADAGTLVMEPLA